MEKMPGVPKTPELQGYSPEFKQDVEKFGMQKLLEESHVKGSFEDWERGRRFLAKAIDRDGKILDIGCANGFLLRSLQEWSGKQLDPYGIDIDESMIERSRELFPDQTEHFALNEEAKKRMENDEFPKQFDLVYWNVWDNLDFSSEKGKDMLNGTLMITAPGGRTILGFYDRKEKDILKKLDQLKTMGLSGKLTWSPTHEEAALIIDKAEE